MEEKKKRICVLFLCTGNSCRSQMAEGLARHYCSDEMEVSSAGTKKHGLNQKAVKVMGELGIDISNHFSKTTDELHEKEFDFVVTVCDNAREACPWFPAKTAIIHHGFDDPPFLEKQEAAKEGDSLDVYRRVRDEIKDFVISLPKDLPSTH
eukprot:m.3195 g.3195  ORF g.3195 m.3195 type:complete len:151 (-) comp3305_c0_seq1:277-729(-)